MSKALTKLTNPARHRLWAELAEDSRLGSLRFGTLGWVPRKVERVVGVQDKFAFCVLRDGSVGTFWDEESGETRRVRGPGVFFVSPGGRQNYGPGGAKDSWDEFYWIVEGERPVEWARLGWWDRRARFHSVTGAFASAAWAEFGAACDALERRDGRALDRAKLALERRLAEGPWAEDATVAPGVDSPITGVVEAWRRDLARSWSLPDCAREAGLSYTRFRARFAAEYGCGPHAHLMRLRLELARRWLRSTDEPVKSVAVRCGFSRVEPFIRAFARESELTPGRWREREAKAMRGDKKLAPEVARVVRKTGRRPPSAFHSP